MSCYPSRFLTWLVAHPNLELDVRSFHQCQAHALDEQKRMALNEQQRMALNEQERMALNEQERMALKV